MRNINIITVAILSGCWLYVVGGGVMAQVQSRSSQATQARSYHSETMTVPRFGLITRFWAQEAIGAPEAHALLAKLEAKGFEFYQPRIAVFTERVGLSDAFKNVRIAKELGDNLAEEADDNLAILREYADDWQGDEFAEAYEDYHKIMNGEGKDSAHIAAVANLLAGEPPVGISRHGVIASIATLEYEHAGKGQSRVYLAQNTSAYIDIVHLSMFLQKPSEYKAVASLSSLHGNFLLIGSAGNDFPNQVFGDNSLSGISFISVGSYDPAGSPSHFSQYGNLNILAPSDDYIQTHVKNSTDLTTFGGTSAASPQVSGAVADFLAILPSKRIAYPQLEKLLHATAIPVNVDPEMDGDVRALNYYKLLRVALRIRYEVENDLDSDRVPEMIADAATYDFSAEAEQAKQLALKSVGEDYFTHLRQAFFLNPHDKETRMLLSSFYRANGLKAQAIYYGDHGQAMSELLTLDAHKYRQHLKKVHEAEVFAADHKLTAEYKDFVLTAIKINNPAILNFTISRISSYASDGDLDIIAAVGINPAELATEKPNLFKLLKKHQAKLRK